MGLIAVCEFEIGSARFSGEAHLEPAELRLKARSTTVIPFTEIRAQWRKVARCEYVTWAEKPPFIWARTRRSGPSRSAIPEGESRNWA